MLDRSTRRCLISRRPMKLTCNFVSCSENLCVRLTFDEIAATIDAIYPPPPFDKPAGSQISFYPISSVCCVRMLYVVVFVLLKRTQNFILQCGQLLLFALSVIQILAIGRQLTNFRQVNKYRYTSLFSTGLLGYGTLSREQIYCTDPTWP